MYLGGKVFFSNLLDWFKKLSKRSFYTLILLFLVLLGGVFALAGSSSFNIFASSGYGSFHVSTTNAGANASGVSVWIQQGLTDVTSGLSDPNGLYVSSQIPYGPYTISAGFPGQDGQLCSGQVLSTLGSASKSVTVNITCSGSGSSPTATITPSRTPSPTPLRSPSPYPSPTPIGNFSINGKVLLLNTTNPLANVSVSLSVDAGRSYTAATDSNGNYSMSIPIADWPAIKNQRIYFDKINYKPYQTYYLSSLARQISSVTTGGSYQLTDAHMSLDSANLTVFGSVKDQNDNLLPGLTVDVSSCQPHGGGGPWSGMSDARVVQNADLIAMNSNTNFFITNIKKPTDTLHQCISIGTSKPNYTLVSVNGNPATYNGFRYTAYTSVANPFINVKIVLRENSAPLVSSSPSPKPLLSPAITPSWIPSPVPTTGVPSFGVRGKVVDENKAPLPEVLISISTPSGKSYSAISANDGSYSINNLISETSNDEDYYLVSSEKIGYPRLGSKMIGDLLKSLPIKYGALNELSDIELVQGEKMFTVYGSVKDQNNVLLDKISLYLMPCSWLQWKSSTSKNDLENFPGMNRPYNYSFLNINKPCDCYKLYAAKDGYIIDENNDGRDDMFVSFTLGATNPKKVDITMKPASTVGPKSIKVQGKITVSGSDYLLPGAKVEIMSTGSGTNWTTVSSASAIDGAGNNYSKSFSSPVSRFVAVLRNLPDGLIIPETKFFSVDQLDANGTITINFNVESERALLFKIVKESNKQAIAGADVNVFDNGKKFQSSKKSDSKGYVLFTSETDSYYQGTPPLDLRVKVSSGGYYTKIQPALRNNVQVIKLESSFSSTGQIKVNVYKKSYSSEKPLQNAKVSLRYDSSKAAIVTKNTSADGSVVFTRGADYSAGALLSNKVILSAFLQGYFDGDGGAFSSNSYISILGNNHYEVNLYLTELSTVPKLEEKVRVQFKNTNYPIEDAEVKFEENEIQWLKKTETDGYAPSQTFFTGRPYQITVSKDFTDPPAHRELTKQVTFPSDWFLLSDKEQENFRQANLRFYFDEITPSQGTKITFKVVDNKNKPISNAKVGFRPKWLSCIGENVAEYYVGYSNSLGEVVFKDGFKFRGSFESNFTTGSLTDAESNSTFTDGEDFVYQADKAGYERSGGRANLDIADGKATVVIKLYSDHQDASKGTVVNRIKVYVDPSLELTSTKLQKKNGTAWQNVSVRSSLAQDNDRVIYFYPELAGTYRAVNNARLSGEREYSPTKSPVLFIDKLQNLCEASDMVYSKYGDLTIVFENQVMQKEFNSLVPDLVATYSSLANQSKRSKPLIIFIGNLGGQINAYAHQEKISCTVAGVQEAWEIDLLAGFLRYMKNLGAKDTIYKVLAHEYGHIVQFDLFYNSNFFSHQWAMIFNDLKQNYYGPMVFDMMTDGNAMIAPNQFGGHPWDNERELFASFFASYFMAHDRFDGIIRYHASGAAQNTMEYMWQLFSENVGKVYANDNTIYHPKGGKIGAHEYTVGEIRSGAWKQ